MTLRVVTDSGECHFAVEGRRLTDDQLLVAARSWRGRTVRIVGDVDTPYKCIGGAVFAVQRAGVMRVGFELSPKE